MPIKVYNTQICRNIWNILKRLRIRSIYLCNIQIQTHERPSLFLSDFLALHRGHYFIRQLSVATSWSLVYPISLLNLSGFFTYHQINIQQFYTVLALRSVFCTDLRTDSEFSLYIINWLIFITLVESVYSAVRTDCLYKTDYVWALNNRGVKCSQRGMDWFLI